MGEAFQIRPDALTHIPAQVAANWARAGFPVFPCNPATKAPLTPHGFKDATADLQTVAAWWQAHPNALVGLATGEASGLFVIDLDVDKKRAKPWARRPLGRWACRTFSARFQRLQRQAAGGTSISVTAGLAIPPASWGRQSTRGAMVATSSPPVP